MDQIPGSFALPASGVERLGLGGSSGGNAAGASRLTMAATRKPRRGRRGAKKEALERGDLAGEWLAQMPRGLSLTVSGIERLRGIFI